MGCPVRFNLVGTTGMRSSTSEATTLARVKTSEYKPIIFTTTGDVKEYDEVTKEVLDEIERKQEEQDRLKKLILGELKIVKAELADETTDVTPRMNLNNLPCYESTIRILPEFESRDEHVERMGEFMMDLRKKDYIGLHSTVDATFRGMLVQNPKNTMTVQLLEPDEPRRRSRSVESTLKQ